MDYEIFISHSAADAPCANAICAKLGTAGIRCWVAPRDVTPSREWAEEIIDAINAVSVMILVFSSNSNASPQVRREVERAIHKGVVVIPFRIENVLPSKSLEYFLSSQHWLDAFSGPLDTHFDRLLNLVRSLPKRNSVQGDVDGGVAVSEPTRPMQSQLPAQDLISQRDLAFVEAQLARFVGPVATVLVKHAARKASSFAAVVALLAAEIELDKERNSFLENCRQHTR